MSDEPAPSDRLAERADALVAQAGLLARWATRTGTELARRLPGAAAVESELQQLERTVLAELRRRLDNVDPLHDGGPAADEPATNPIRTASPRSAPPRTAGAPRPAPTTPPRQTEPLRAAMAELLMRSIEQTGQRAREYLYLAILRQLLPDEARILSALADGSAYPLVHVDCRTGVSGSRRILSHASTVGRAAGVAVPASVPRYLTRLLQLDLVEIGEPDPALTVQYDMCLTEPSVRAAEDAARAAGRVRVVRRTLRISPLGREVWDACHPRADGDPTTPPTRHGASRSSAAGAAEPPADPSRPSPATTGEAPTDEPSLSWPPPPVSAGVAPPFTTSPTPEAQTPSTHPPDPASDAIRPGP